MASQADVDLLKQRCDAFDLLFGKTDEQLVGKTGEIGNLADAVKAISDTVINDAKNVRDTLAQSITSMQTEIQKFQD